MAEQNAMLKYFELRDCRLQYLRECLDDRLATACGRATTVQVVRLSRGLTGVIEQLEKHLSRVESR